MRPGDHVEVVDGHDRVETTYLRVDPTPPNPPLPDVERDLWTPGVTGISADVVGEHSGEVAPRLALAPSSPAAPVPGNVISLTFDDGPDPKYTPRILDILRQAGVHATFCMVGTQARAYPDLVKAVHDAGHTICDHTEHHPHLDQLAAPDVDGEIGGMAAFLQATTGEAPRFVRVPYGGVNDTVVQTAHAARAAAARVVDRPERLPEALADRDRRPGLRQPAPRGHRADARWGGDRTNTIAVLPVIINGLKAKGYTIVQPTGTDRWVDSAGASVGPLRNCSAASPADWSIPLGASVGPATAPLHLLLIGRFRSAPRSVLCGTAPLHLLLIGRFRSAPRAGSSCGTAPLHLLIP